MVKTVSLSLVGKKKKSKAKQARSAPLSTSTVVIAPAARSTVEHAATGRMTNPRPGAICVKRREFVATVTNGTATSFTLDANTIASPGWDFNPGVSSLFPWLSQLANAYERFRFKHLSFELVSSCSTGTAGRVYMAVDYDWDDEVPATKAQMMGNATAVEGPVWHNLRVVTDPKSLMRDMPFKYVNTAGRVTYSEPRTAYAGFLILGFDTPTVSCKWDLWVDYDIELEVPVVENLGATLSSPTWEPVAPYVTTNDPWYSATATGVLVGVAKWTANRFVGSLVREVVSGVGDAPVFEAPTGVTLTGSGPSWGTALDIARLGLRHYLKIHGSITASGKTPTTLMTNGARANSYVYDALGSFLGSMIDDSGSPVAGLSPVENACEVIPGEQGTAGKPCRPALTVSVQNIRDIWPTARFLLPALVLGTGASVTGSATTGVDYNIF